MPKNKGADEKTLDTLVEASVARGIKIITDRGEKPTDEQMQVFNDPKTKAAMKNVLRDSLANGEIGEQRVTTFLSGSNGAKNLLINAAKESDQDIPKSVAAAIGNSAFFNFSKAKESMSKELGTDVGANYDKLWRPLVSGMDRTVGDYTRTSGMNLLIDNTLAINEEDLKGNRNREGEINKESKGYVVDRTKLEAENGGKVQVFAVALTPDQSAAEAKKMGIPEAEARRTAANFAAGFEELKNHVPDLTLVGTDMKPIYFQKNGEAVGNTPEMAMKVAAWKEASLPKQEQHEQDKGVKDPTPLPPSPKMHGRNDQMMR